ncbi:MAG: N-6 DNA methylase [Candidatus Pacebacteria bacterium]|nr:N-6 DNA methylase [Candidatus Paceibacterota bacterium]
MNKNMNNKNNNQKLNQKGRQIIDIKILENWLKSAADLLRGRSEGLNYIITLLFYKRLCDVFDDEVSEIKQDINLLNEKDLERVIKEAKLTRFFIPKEAHFQEVRKTTVNLGERLDNALFLIAKENPQLQGVIDIIQFNETRYDAGQRKRIISDDTITKLLEVFNRYTIGLDETESDILGDAYEYLLRLYSSDKGKTAGEFYTPGEIAFLMAYCLDPQEGEEIYDPAVGSGGLLIKNHLVLKEKTSAKIQKPLKLYGQERDHLTYALAKINMFIHDIPISEIRLGDTLLNPAFLENNRLKKFDVAVANPMWNQKGYDDHFYDSDQYERFSFGYPPQNTADWGWVQHMFSSLKPNGRMAIVLDTGAVSRGSGERKDREKAIRQKFVEQDLIDAVLLLPENLFYNTGAPGIIMFLRKQKPENRKGKILLINGSREFEKGKPKNFLTPANIEKISKTYRNFEEVEGLSKIITVEEAKEADYNLSPSRFVSIIEEEKHRPIGEIVEELKQVEKESQNKKEELIKILEKLS